MNILLIAEKDYKKYLKNYNVTKTINYIEIINYLKQDFDSIIIDGLLDINVLKVLNNYPNPFYLSRTIILDNNYTCYSLLENKEQLFAIIKHHNIDNLEYYLKELEKRNAIYNINKANIYDEISTILKRLGLSPDKDGFHYLRKAVYESYINPSIKNNYSKLYTILEETFLISRKDIERSMRYSISIGYIKSDYEYSERLFSNTLTTEQVQPKNSEFIAIVLEELLLLHHKTLY